jgi:NAD(P)-dependent dehydrogenase (short-subunit alcohol dehydrogenase family)
MIALTRRAQTSSFEGKNAVITVGASGSGKGVRVNTISPGPIDTPFHEGRELPVEVAARLDTLLQAAIPMGRLGRGEEAAAVACLLLSDEASFVTRADYPIDGGEAQL